tara:strand:+ start:5033 stop:5200 length:168 start_codon:yes stop_codon:yes gene_type:complete
MSNQVSLRASISANGAVLRRPPVIKPMSNTNEINIKLKAKKIISQQIFNSKTSEA